MQLNLTSILILLMQPKGGAVRTNSNVTFLAQGQGRGIQLVVNRLKLRLIRDCLWGLFSKTRFYLKASSSVGFVKTKERIKSGLKYLRIIL